MNAEIFVLNFNGKELLCECLPSILEASRQNPKCPVTVIDNQSRDGSVAMLQNEFTDVKVLIKENRVLCSFNEAVRESSADIVLLLNNDLKVEKDFIRPLLKVFEEHQDAFLASPKALTFDQSRYEGSLSKMSFKTGILRCESRFKGYEKKIDHPGITMQSGFGAYRRDVFLGLGGFDDLYLPGTVEDSDLCFRAWKAGYACYYVPGSRVYHKGQATFGRSFSRSRLLAINQRNLYLFTWKNISDPSLILKHLLWFLIRPLVFLIQGRHEFFLGFLWAFLRLPQALKRRFSLGRRGMRSDRKIFALSETI